MSVLRLVSPTQPAAAPLLAGLRAQYHDDYGPEVAAELDRYSPVEFLPPSGAFLIIEQAGITIAGGALRRLGAGVGEIKRMWTAPEHRGRGHARRILRELEAAATRRGYHTVRLETGDLQLAAVELYRSAGYREVDPYGPYKDHPRCRCFEKRLDGRDHLGADALDGHDVVMRQVLEHHPLHAGRRQPA
jgi:ribosomal protein S18 acetylase RimI-like enzyme